MLRIPQFFHDCSMLCLDKVMALSYNMKLRRLKKGVFALKNQPFIAGNKPDNALYYIWKEKHLQPHDETDSYIQQEVKGKNANI